ncbi:hypothetical protein CISIN_1g039156mg [Citrus sinensis]|uniref:Uncharacterized protein n=1 Tax=Citrus sinensis TaxID=2711 RepID=A0A067DQA3_CITSI|nr:hypothetical protein CISIN_1g039156mg [Citrus sinensis]
MFLPLLNYFYFLNRKIIKKNTSKCNLIKSYNVFRKKKFVESNKIFLLNLMAKFDLQTAGDRVLLCI